MKLSKEHAARIAEFPATLRALIKAELAAGNAITEIASCFPAPPAGAYAKLARHVSARRRKSGNGLDFYERNSSSYSGEFTDTKRFYFVLEPPLPPPPEPDMNAIRAALDARHAAQLSAALDRTAKERQRSRNASNAMSRSTRARRPGPSPAAPPPPSTKTTALDRFCQSMEMNYEKWHDGIGYDLEIIRTATAEERASIEDFLVNRPVDDWRDVEALAELDSPRARAVLLNAARSRGHEIATAVADYAPDLLSEAERTRTLVAALEGAKIFGGLTQALDQVEEFHPPEVIEALFRGALARDGETAVHLAAMLMFLHGKADTAFDMDQRPFFLRFNTDKRAEREAVFRELCEKINVPADKYVDRFDP